MNQSKVQMRQSSRSRPGLMLLDALIAVGFLAVAGGAILQINQARLDQDRNSSHHLVDQLTVENAAEQLSQVPYDDLTNAAEQIGKQSGLKLEIESFDTQGSSGVHVTIRIESKRRLIEQHVWRLAGQS